VPFALAFGLGAVAGLRSLTAPAAVAWGARLHLIRLEETPFAFLGSAPAAWLLLALMIGELVMDKLPTTPSRTLPGPFAARILSGGFSGAALAAGMNFTLLGGALAGVLGAVAGTLAGYRSRTGLVRTLRVPDYVVAVLEDIVAVGWAFVILAAAH
jgi:uncharacterized membrane protein